MLSAATPAYASADLLDGKASTPADDIYSLACMAYRLTSGTRVYGKASAREARKTGLVPERIESLTDSQWEALRRALSHDAAERQATAREFAEQFVDLSDAPPVERPPRRVRFARYVPLATGVAVTAIVVLLGWLALRAFAPADDTADLAASGDTPVEATVVTAGNDTSDPAPQVVPPVRNDDPVTAVQEAQIEANDGGNGESSAIAPLETPAPAVERIVLGVTGAGTEAPPLIEVEEREQTLRLTFAKEAETAFADDAVRVYLTPADPDWKPLFNTRLVLKGGSALSFDNGATEAEVAIDVIPDSSLAADQLYYLTAISADDPDTALARVALQLRDSELAVVAERAPPDSIGFVAGFQEVFEYDGAIAITVIRTTPGDYPLSRNFLLESTSAVDGEDYFAPVSTTINFEPGEGTAKLLIPLVNDGIAETAETLNLSLLTNESDTLLPVEMQIRILDDDLR